MLATLLTFLLQAPQTPVPTVQDHARWLAAIEPNATELAYQAIPWRNEFWPAVQEARALGRPILLWTMNGHPLGCT